MTEVFFQWSDSFSVGIPEIDEQHKVLVSLLNQLHAAFRERNGTQASREILDRLAEYTRTHFLLEESLMRISRYPGLDEHRAQHEDLIKQVTSLQTKLDAGKASISVELLQFLLNWLSKHINESDKRFGQHFCTSTRQGYAQWTQEVEQTLQKKQWWKFW
jgi:hemerythrin